MDRSMDGLSSSDVALLQDRGGFGDGNMGFFWIFALLLLANGGIGWGGNNAFNAVSQADLAASQNAQTQQLQLNNLSNELLNNKFDIAQAINAQTNQLEAQNNTNLINAIQGFNNLGLQITNQTNQLGGQIAALSSKLDTCCCEIKTQMLQYRLEDANAKIVSQNAELSNLQQSQYILGQLGRFVAWTPSGTQAATGS